MAAPPGKQAWEAQAKAQEHDLHATRKQLNRQIERCSKLEQAYRERNARLAARKADAEPAEAAEHVPDAAAPSVLPKSDVTVVEVWYITLE